MITGSWLTVVLGLALIVILAYGVQQIPSSRPGQAGLAWASTLWVSGFLAIWLGIQIVLGLLLGVILGAVIAAQGPLPDPSGLRAEAPSTSSGQALKAEGLSPSGRGLTSLIQQDLNEIIVAAQFIGLLAVLVAAFVGQRRFRRQSILDLGLRTYAGWLLDAAMGLLLGFIGFVPLFAVALAAGQVTTDQGALALPFVQRLLTAVLVFVMVAFGEEIFARGFILQTLELGLGTVAAALGSSLVWGLLHLTNPGATSAAVINITASGFVFAYGYLITRSLWLPIALHFSWNFSEGVLFGFPVSGLKTPGIVSSQLPGPDFITGGIFGPEGGLIIIPVIALQILILRWWLNARPTLGMK